jgi:hypothetical protein
MKKAKKRGAAITLSPVKFEHLIAAALATPPERKPKKKAARKAPNR